MTYSTKSGADDRRGLAMMLLFFGHNVAVYAENRLHYTSVDSSNFKSACSSVLAARDVGWGAMMFLLSNLTYLEANTLSNPILFRFLH